MKIEDIEKLKRNNQELQEIINNSWDGIAIIDKSTKFVYVNNAFVPILGFSKDELINNNFTSLMEKKYVKKRKLLKLKLIKEPKMVKNTHFMEKLMNIQDSNQEM